MRLTLTEDGRLVTHAPLGERNLSADEAAKIRDALDAPGLPWWLDFGAVALGVLALVIVFGRGGGA